MAKIKYTKNELKLQKDNLARFRRFLPTLILKKQQLQMEIRDLQAKKDEKRAVIDNIQNAVMKWVDVFGEDADIESLLKIQNVNTETGNIAGIDIPVFHSVEFEELPYDLFETPLWIDAALEKIREIIDLTIEMKTLDEAIELLHEEMRITTQRVNLFEKLKIPEAKENIRVIRIFMGDEQTAAVVRGKIAKNKLVGKAA